MRGIISRISKSVGRISSKQPEKSLPDGGYFSGNVDTDSYDSWDTGASSKSNQSRQKKDVVSLDRRSKEHSVSGFVKKMKEGGEESRRVFHELSKLSPEEQRNFAISAVDSLRNRLNSGLWKADNTNRHSDQSRQKKDFVSLDRRSKEHSVSGDSYDSWDTTWDTGASSQSNQSRQKKDIAALDRRSKESSVSDVAKVSKRRDSPKREIFVAKHDNSQESGSPEFANATTTVLGKIPQLRAKSKKLNQDIPGDIYKDYEAFLAGVEGVDMSGKWSTDGLSTKELHGHGEPEADFLVNNDVLLALSPHEVGGKYIYERGVIEEKKDIAALDRRSKESSVYGFVKKMKEGGEESRRESYSLGRRPNGNPGRGRV